MKNLKVEKNVFDIPVDDKEVKCLTTAGNKVSQSSLLDEAKCYSSWFTVKIVIAYCLRFIDNIKRRVQHEPVENASKLMTVSELHKAEVCITRAVQSKCFPEYIKCYS